MQTKKTKLAIAIGSIGLFMGAAQLANAGLVEVNVGAKVPTFSTDISGPGSDNQPFFAPDVRWTPGENIAADSSVRFNLGGKDGDPARFATNPIDVNNFVFVSRNPIVGAYTGAPTVTLAAANAAVTAAQASIVNAAVAAATTDAERMAAINAAAAALAPNFSTSTPVQIAAADTAAAAALAGVPAADRPAAAAGIVNALVAINDAAAQASFPLGAFTTAAVVGGTAAVPVMLTNGDAATWVDGAGQPFGRIFQTTTAGGINSFDVTVNVRLAITGDADGDAGLTGLVGDSIVLSLNSGKYVNPDNTPRTFSQGPLLDTNVDITNLKAQGFDGTTVVGYESASGTINMIVSVQQGGLTRDTGNTGNSNRTLYAASANPLQFITYPGNAGSTASTAFPTTINLAAEELKFSHNALPTQWYANGLDLPAASDFFNHIGSFRFDIAALSGTNIKQYNDWGPVAGNRPYTQVSDPIGNQYALTAGDTINLTVGVKDNLPNALAPFTAAGAYFLRSSSGDCTAVSGGTDINLTVNAAAGTATNANASLTGGTTYTVCARANGTTEIVPHTATVTATLQNIEPTYQDPTFPAQDLGTWVRNGCDATFFNVPGNGPDANTDKAFLRFTNTTSATTAGTIRAKVWGQDGRLVGTGKLLATRGTAGLTGSLSGHQTGVYTAHDVARAIGLTPADNVVNAWAGERVRVVMSGGFATCEGQNMINTNGILVNATTTTNANTNSINVPGRERFNGNNSN